MPLPKNYRLTVRNLTGATCDVKVIWQGNTSEDNGSGRQQPYYGAEATVISNAALADQGEESSSPVINSEYLGISGNVIVTPAASASGRLELWLVTLDDAGANPSTLEGSRHLRTLSWQASTAPQTGSYFVA